MMLAIATRLRALWETLQEPGLRRERIDALGGSA